MLARHTRADYAVVLPNQNDQRCLATAERIRRAVEVHKFIWEKRRVKITVSIGICTYRLRNLEDPREMIDEAERCLFEAKRDGRNRVVGNY